MAVLKIRVEGSYTHELSIPENWRFSPLNQVIEIVGGSQPAKTFFSSVPGEGFIRLIQIRDYKSDKHIVYIPKEKARRFVNKDDVMIGRYGPPIFQILRGIEGAYNVALMKAVPILGGIDNDFLFHYLNNRNLFNYVESASDRTAGQSGVNKAHLEKYPVGVPPFAEQKEIAKQLDCLLMKVDSIKNHLDAIPEIIKRFRQSVFTSAESGNLSIEWRKNNEIAESKDLPLDKIFDIDSGQVFKKSQYSNSGSRLLQISNVAYGQLKWKNEAFVPLDLAKEHSRFSMESDDLVMALNRPITNGWLKISLVNDVDLPATLYQRVARMRLKSQNVIVKYCFFAMRSEKFKKSVEENLKGSDQPYINTSDLKNLKIKHPTYGEQKYIAGRVEQFLAFADNVENKVNVAQERINNLTQSILAKAFRGELTTEWRELNQALITGENSAEALLAKIKTEREALSKKPSAKTKTPKKKVAKKTTAGKAQT